MKTWEENYLAHYGITGQKWGVRRFQNEDRTLTEAGKERYRKSNQDSKIVVNSSSHEADGYKIDRHTFSAKGNNEKRARVDKIAKNKDYDSASEFDRIGEHALSLFEKEGKDTALKFLSEKLNGHEYKYTVNKETDINNGESYLTYALSVLGAHNSYNTFGENNYSDDQYFSKR